MVINGSFRNNKMTLATQTPMEASVIKGGIAGDNPYLSTPPFGNKVDFNLHSNTITITKSSGQPLTYEEARAFIKKVILFGKISEKDARSLLDMARIGLESRITFFYPNSSCVECCFFCFRDFRNELERLHGFHDSSCSDGTS